MKNEEVIKDFGSIAVPSKWEDITLKKYQEIENYYENVDDNFNILDVLDILIDKDRDYINSLPVEFLDTILAHLVFITIKPEIKKPTNKIIIDGEEYSINIMEKLRVGEYVAVDSVLKANKHDYASILAILCRKKDEKYDSYFENEVLEERIKLFEKQPIINILPIVEFFFQLFIASKKPSLLYSQVEEGINLIQQSIKSLEKIGASKKLYLNYQAKKLKKSLKSIKSI